MRFVPGQSGNPAGRVKGSKGGRSLALLTLDRMLAKQSNQAKLAEDLEKEFRANPVRFFKSIIMPLLPREARLAVEQSGVVGWRSLVSARISGVGLACEGEDGGLRSEVGSLKAAGSRGGAEIAEGAGGKGSEQ